MPAPKGFVGSFDMGGTWLKWDAWFSFFPGIRAVDQTHQFGADLWWCSIRPSRVLVLPVLQPLTVLWLCPPLALPILSPGLELKPSCLEGLKTWQAELLCFSWVFTAPFSGPACNFPLATFLLSWMEVARGAGRRHECAQGLGEELGTS